MEAIFAAFVRGETHAFGAVLWGGLIAGSMDLTAALITAGRNGVKPMRVLQYIASGLLGQVAFKGGSGTAALGAALHYLIAFGATVIFYEASLQLRFLVKQPIIWGLVYGIVVYLVMNLIVLPLSSVRRMPITAVSLVMGLIVHMLCVGLPISLVVWWFSK